MGRLHILPSQIANMIAAGEVVGRPASVVKELMENAVDAGATKISVVVTDSGRTLVQVIDDGCGMSPEDATLCFERHATSKIQDEADLESIMTFGFRGEALASISAVAEIELKTRREEDATATKVTIGNFGVMASSECSAPKGTSIAVRNLFYNTPARRKFLKSDAVELKHIIEEFTRVAMTRPEIAFCLIHNGHEVLDVKKAKSLKFRIQDLLGAGVVGEVVDLAADTSILGVSGYVGKPESAKKTLGNQYFFVNGRFFRSPYLHKAVMNAYSEVMPEGLTPSYFIFLTVDPHSVDVNISPTKAEVKFEQDSIIFQTLYACVRETLGRNSFGGGIDFDTEGAVQMPQIGNGFSAYRPDNIAPAVDFDPNFNPFSSEPDTVQNSPAAWQAGTSQYVGGNRNYGALFEERAVPASGVFILQGRYIATPTSAGVLLVNIRRAYERIMYEQMLDAMVKGEKVSQTALFPIQMQIAPAQMALIEENRDVIAKIGFDIAPFGQDTIAVSGVPEGYQDDENAVRETVVELIGALGEGRHAGLGAIMDSALAAKLAFSGSARAKTPATPQEAQALIDSLFGCANAELTPAGKKITSVISYEEIEKRF